MDSKQKNYYISGSTYIVVEKDNRNNSAILKSFKKKLGNLYFVPINACSLGVLCADYIGNRPHFSL